MRIDRPGRLLSRSADIDFVAVTADRLDADALATLTARHASLPGPAFEGLYLTRAELAAGPLAIGPTSYARQGRLHPAGIGQVRVVRPIRSTQEPSDEDPLT